MLYQQNPAFSMQASDWKISTICQIDGADVVGGGIWFVKFQSRQAATDEPFNSPRALLGPTAAQLQALTGVPVGGLN